MRRLRDLPGVLLRDWSRYQRAFAQSGNERRSDPTGWISLCNRIERLTPNLLGPGVRCEWEFGSDLHATQVLPTLGQQLMQRSLAEWPIHFCDSHVSQTGPLVSFVFAHGGRQRLPQLRRTIRSIFAQQQVRTEVIVVDQTPESLAAEMPAGVQHHRLDSTHLPTGWRKSWAYNVGAKRAIGEILVFHDGDVCVPTEYASEVARLIADGAEVVSAQRFLYYLSPSHTERVEAADHIEASEPPQRIYQNWKGGTIAFRRSVFFEVGGFDEGFVDWGGEDDELFERCRDRQHWRWGYLPFAHLWHPPQSGRKAADNLNITNVMPWRMGISRANRIRELTTRQFGCPERPDPIVSYKDQSNRGSA